MGSGGWSGSGSSSGVSGTSVRSVFSFLALFLVVGHDGQAGVPLVRVDDDGRRFGRGLDGWGGLGRGELLLQLPAGDGQRVEDLHRGVALVLELVELAKLLAVLARADDKERALAVVQADADGFLLDGALRRW